MRIVIDTLVALMLAGILAGVTLHQQNTRADDAAVEMTRQSVQRINREIRLRAQLGQVTLSEQGFPTTVDPEWFDNALPRNTLINDGRPWIEVAPIEQRGIAHPLDIAASGKTVGAFWYNPAQGTVRARVPAGLSDAATIDLYNTVNSSDVNSRFPVGSTSK